MKRMKFKTLTLKTMKNDQVIENVYHDKGQIAFALCSAEKEKTVEQLSMFYYCREASIGKAATLLIQEKTLPKRNIWLLVHRNARNSHSEAPNEANRIYFERWVKNGLKNVNHFERKNKWLISKIYKAKHKFDESNDVYIFKGSRWWINSAHLFSLFMLLIRIGTYSQFDNINKSTKTNKIIDCILAIKDGDRDYHRTRNAEMWPILLNNRRKIYEKRDILENFQVVLDHGSWEGIQTLTDGKCYDKKVYKKFIKFCIENKAGNKDRVQILTDL